MVDRKKSTTVNTAGWLELEVGCREASLYGFLVGFYENLN